MCPLPSVNGADTVVLSQLPPILATGFKSSVGTVVSSLFQWTQEGACGGEEGDPKLTKHDEYVRVLLRFAHGTAASSCEIWWLRQVDSSARSLLGWSASSTS